jgi:hypothetical protein
MKYDKPEVVCLTEALTVVQGGKQAGTPVDFDVEGYKSTMNAYESDE